MSNTIVVYHSNCTDGISAAWCMHKALGDSAEYIPGVHQRAPNFDPEGKIIYLVDFCYPPEVMRSLIERGAKKIILIDHHQRPVDAIRNNKTLMETGKIEVHHGNYLNSGAVLAFFYVKFDMPGADVFGDQILPVFFKFVEDRDLWKWEYSITRPILEVFRMEHPTIERVDEFVELCEDDDEIKTIIEQGNMLIKVYETDKEQLLRHARRPVKIFNQKLEMVNCPPKFSSDIGHILAQENKIGITYCDGKDHRIFSLRGDGSVNLAKLAERYGGGGHHNAAGFTVPRNHPLAMV
jgi:oligoribonuclease NrnB/cAMP/cGMP phosphodiesterase (DHH superfamily)